MATARSFTYRNPASQLGYSQRMANLADTNILVAPRGTNADPLDLDAWYLLGIVTGESTINPNLEMFEVMTGSPQTRKATIKTKQADTLTVEVSHLTLVGMQLAYANDFLPTVSSGITVAADGQTTVASTSDNFTTTVASSSNIAAGDLCLVQNSANGSAYYDELAYVEQVSANVITHNMLSQRPTASTPFKKIKGSALTATGIKFTSGGAIYPELEWLIVRYMHTSKYMYIQHRKRGQIVQTDGFNFNVAEPMKTNATINFIDQGSDSDGCLYGYDWLVPYES